MESPLLKHLRKTLKNKYKEHSKRKSVRTVNKTFNRLGDHLPRGMEVKDNIQKRNREASKTCTRLGDHLPEEMKAKEKRKNKRERVEPGKPPQPHHDLTSPECTVYDESYLMSAPLLCCERAEVVHMKKKVIHHEWAVERQ